MKTLSVIILAVLIVAVTSRIFRYPHRYRRKLSDGTERYVSLHRMEFSICIYIITQVILAFCLVLACNLLEDRRRIDIIVSKFFPLCFKMAESFENLDAILRDWAKNKIHKTHAEAVNWNEKHIKKKDKACQAGDITQALVYVHPLLVCRGPAVKRRGEGRVSSTDTST